MRLPTAMWLVFAGLAFGGGYSSRSASSSSDGGVPRNGSSAYGDDGDGGSRSEARGGHRNFAGISEVLDALEKAVVFFLESYHDINLDGLYGLRVAEG
ncbi:Hypp4891 [Branchiostoma lanceolatum]|nr:Hypp4891 [Branchiostoma lanceolatum]